MAQGYIPAADGQEGVERGAQAARDLPKAEKAGAILAAGAAAVDFGERELAAGDCLEFDHYTIAKVAPGQLWLRVHAEGKNKQVGPVPVPEAATRLLEVGWDVSCSLRRTLGTWRLAEVANVYPH